MEKFLKKLCFRGLVGKTFTCDNVLLISRYIASYLISKNRNPKVLIGIDTRRSSVFFMNILSFQLSSVGIDVFQVDVIPTPAIAYLVNLYDMDLGIVITASHNSSEYNGIKLFDKSGIFDFDLNMKEYDCISSQFSQIQKKINVIGSIEHIDTAIDDYVDHLVSISIDDYRGIKFAVDCANGSASFTAPILFKKLNCDVVLLNYQPDGFNINNNCGSTNIQYLAKYVKSNKLNFGIAFDGDADRIVVVDGNGDIIDGDKLLAVFSINMLNKKELLKNTIVNTYMSNQGFNEFVRKKGIHLVTTNVGEKNIEAELKKNNYSLGGEQSGHIVLKKFSNTGDGELCAVYFLNIVMQNKESLSSILEEMVLLPQILFNVIVNEYQKKLYDKDINVISKIKQAKETLQGKGRVFVRSSSTEPLIRVRIEGENFQLIKGIGNDICDAIQQSKMSNLNKGTVNEV